MLFDLSSPLQRQNFLLRCDALSKKQCIVELKEKKPIRTLSQNAYLHTILAYFGAITGNSLDYVKRMYFKILVNPETFIRETEDKYLGKIKILRSSADLDKEEMTMCISRFIDWSAQEAGIYIPSSEDYDLIRQMEIEIERNKQYL